MGSKTCPTLLGALLIANPRTLNDADQKEHDEIVACLRTKCALWVTRKTIFGKRITSECGLING